MIRRHFAQSFIALCAAILCPIKLRSTADALDEKRDEPSTAAARDYARQAFWRQFKRQSNP